ncbi:MAG TPA: tripartite tricarboxylate transporter permease, partial [Pseudonocardiaceae bacterium]|nr:tripartite tricarboxylate transporter permease [Pseudonocardiaceae bacterium]
FNSIYLLSGVSLAVVAIGTFAIPQMVELFGVASRTVKRRHLLADGTSDVVPAASIRDTLSGAAEALRHWVILLRGAVIGFVGGIVPGVGGFATNYISYGVAKQLDRKRSHLYGTGIPEGIVAAESSSLAKEEGSKVMTLGLGLPTGTASALFLVALAIQGVQPGIGFIDRHPVQAYEIVWVLVLCTLLGTAVGVLAGPQLARVTRVPGVLLFPFVIAFCLVGVYIADVTYVAMGEIIALGLVGIVLRRLGYSLGAYMMGVVMGPTLEQNVYLSHRLFPGWTVATDRPVAVVIVAVALVVLVLKVLEVRRADRAERAGKARRGVLARGGKENRHPVLELCTTIALLVLGVGAGWYAATHYDGVTAGLPVVCCGLIVAGTLWQLPRHVDALRHRAEPTTQPDPLTAAMPVAEPPIAPLPTGGGAGTTVLVQAEPKIEDEETTTASPGIVRRAWGRHGQYTREIAAVGWAVGCAVLCWLVGFRLGVGIFALAYGLVASGRALTSRWRKLAFTVASVVVLYVVVSLLFTALGLYEDPLIFIPVPTF